MSSDVLKPEGRYNRPKIGAAPPAGDKNGRYEWMKRRQAIKQWMRQQRRKKTT